MTELISRSQYHYWEPHADPAREGRDEAYYVETYRKVVAEAVQCRLRRATTPAGLFMGGGFDSSAICALAGPAVSAQGRKFIAAASVMPEDYRGTIHHARKWVEMCRRIMPHLDVRYVTREGLDIFTGMEQAFLNNDNGHSPNGYVTRKMMAEIAGAGARILMDGHGGDYTVNPRGQNALVRMLRKGQFGGFITEFNAMRRHLRQSVKQALVRNVLLQLVPASWTRVSINHKNGLALSGPTMPLSRQVIAGRPKNARPQFRWRSGDSQRAGMLRALRNQQNFPAQGYSVSGGREPGCSMCLAMNPDKLAPGERCASTSNRNFEGRQGYKGRTHPVSPAMAAAAAIAGHFVDVRDWK